MCRKIWYDRKSWKLFGFQGELNKALIWSRLVISLKSKNFSRLNFRHIESYFTLNINKK